MLPVVVIGLDVDKALGDGSCEIALYSQFLRLFCKDLVGLRKIVVINRWEYMVDGMEVESCIFEIGNKSSCIVCYHVNTRINLMLSKIMDLLVAFSPSLAVSVAHKGHLHEENR